MKPLLISTVWLLSGFAGFAALPPDVEQLIQTDKFKEALERVEALLREKPDDAELKETRKELQALVPSASPAPKPSAAAAAAPMPPKPATLPPLVAKELELILVDVNRAAGDARKVPLRELFNRTGPLLGTYPDMVSLWSMRGLAALELTEAAAAKQAGANLLRLGADRGGNEQTVALLAMLKRKSWLVSESQLVQERAEEERKKAEQERLAAQRAAAQKEAARRKKAAYDASPEGIAERLRNNVKK